MRVQYFVAIACYGDKPGSSMAVFSGENHVHKTGYFFGAYEAAGVQLPQSASRSLVMHRHLCRISLYSFTRS